MSIKYLISQIETDNGFPQMLGNSLVNDFAMQYQDQHDIIFISAYPDNYETTDRDVSIILDWFSQIDIMFREVFIIDNRVSKTMMDQYIQRCGIIFLLGGDPLLQIEFMKKNNLFHDMNSAAGIMIGMSAGAINMCRVSICSKDDEINTTTVYHGLGIVDITVEPHFDIHNEKMIKEELYPISNNNTILAIPDDSFIRMDDEKLSFHGEAYVIYKSRIWRPEVCL